jgi:hypothetical protein
VLLSGHIIIFPLPKSSVAFWKYSKDFVYAPLRIVAFMAIVLFDNSPKASSFLTENVNKTKMMIVTHKKIVSLLLRRVSFTFKIFSQIILLST